VAVDECQLETDLKYLSIGSQENGEPLCGGNRLTGGAYEKGYFVEPTVFADVKEGDTLATEEVFVPVLAIVKANDPADALRMANATEFGLSASIHLSARSS
jgi:aldehyde dehydrogenase (NAD+)